VQLFLEPLQDLLVLLVVDMRDGLNRRLMTGVVVVDESVAVDWRFVILRLRFRLRPSKKGEESETVKSAAEATHAEAIHSETTERAPEATHPAAANGAARGATMRTASSAMTACNHVGPHTFDVATTLSGITSW
jgi:hypothetical protein